MEAAAEEFVSNFGESHQDVPSLAAAMEIGDAAEDRARCYPCAASENLHAGLEDIAAAERPADIADCTSGGTAGASLEDTGAAILWHHAELLQIAPAYPHGAGAQVLRTAEDQQAQHSLGVQLQGKAASVSLAVEAWLLSDDSEVYSCYSSAAQAAEVVVLTCRCPCTLPWSSLSGRERPRAVFPCLGVFAANLPMRSVDAVAAKARFALRCTPLSACPQESARACG